MSPAAQPAVELRVVDPHGLGADHDGVETIAHLVHAPPRRRARHPPRVAAGRRDAPVERGGELQYDERKAAGHVLREVLDERSTLLFEHADVDPQSGAAQPRDATTAHPWIRIERADDDAGHARGDNRVHAGRSTPEVAAGLERHVERRAAGASSRLPEREDLGMSPPARR